jgi:hypothetical protein
MDILETFNAKLGEFLNDLCLVCPRISEFRPAFQFAMNVDKRAGINVFDKYANKYEPYIISKNEEFFLNKDFTSSSKADLINEIKQVWTTLSPENKEVVWKYLQVLLFLHKKIKSMNQNM